MIDGLIRTSLQVNGVGLGFCASLAGPPPPGRNALVSTHRHSVERRAEIVHQVVDGFQPDGQAH